MSAYDLPVVVSSALPIVPSDVENIVRLVRHGLADVLAWLGEDVGPKPGDCTHAIKAMGTLFVSQEMHDELAAKYLVPPLPKKCIPSVDNGRTPL